MDAGKITIIKICKTKDSLLFFLFGEEVPLFTILFNNKLLHQKAGDPASSVELFKRSALKFIKINL